MEMEPELVDIVRVELRGLDDNGSHERDQKEGRNVRHQVMVAQFHVLEIHSLKEVWQPLGQVDLNAAIGVGEFGAHDGGFTFSSLLGFFYRGFGSDF